MLPILIIGITALSGTLKSEEPPTLTVCEVLENPGLHDGKIISLRGTLDVGPETRLLGPGDCRILRPRYPSLENWIWLALPGELRTEGSNVRLDKAAIGEYLAIVRDSGMSFDYIPGLSVPKGQQVPKRTPPFVIVTGRLQSKVEEWTTITGLRNYMGYGNLGAFPAQIVMKAIVRGTNGKQLQPSKP